ncbi:MAG: TIGR02302 family protein [Propylenella sp.]
MPLKASRRSDRKLMLLERAILCARVAAAWERLWPLAVPILSVAGAYVALSWLGYWRLGGDWLRLGTLAVLGAALAFGLIRLIRVRLPDRFEGMRRVELTSGLPHRPARGLSDTMSPVADDLAARALWRANQERLYASLKNLRAGRPQPGMTERDRNGLRFAVPVLLAVAFAVAWGEWTPRLAEAFSPIQPPPVAVATRIDAWIDPPAYTRQAPVFLSRRTGAAAAEPVTAPEGSKLTVRVVSRDPAQVTIESDGAIKGLAPKAEGRSEATEEVIRSYQSVLVSDATVRIAHADGETAYPIEVTEDRPPTIARGPMTVNRSGSFTLNFPVTDDYGVTEGNVTFRPVEEEKDVRALVDEPLAALRIDRSQARDGTARGDARLESHPYAGLEVNADAVVKDAAGQEARPVDQGRMTLPARPFYNPLARALVEQRQILALDANKRQLVTTALDALTLAPSRIKDSGIYLGLRVGHARLVNARSDDDLRDVLDYLWEMARAIEDGELSDAEERLNAAREALKQALKDGASQEEIARLMDELRQAMQEFMQSFMAEMAERGIQNLPPMPSDQNMQELSNQDLQDLLDRIEQLAQMGDMEAAQQLLSQLQQMLDNLQMAQPGEMSPMDEEMLRQMDELARMMQEQQRLMDDTFQLNQGRRPGERGQQGGQGPLTQEQLEEMLRQLQQGQGELAERLRQLMEEMGQGGEQGEGEGQQQGENGEGMQPGEGEGMGRSLGRAGRAMGDATRSLGELAPGDAYGYQGEALDALREGLQGMMQQMYANQPGQDGQQFGGRPMGRRDPLGRPERTEGPDLGQNVKVPDEIDVERARRILEAIRNRLGERFRPRYELEYLERLLNLE